MVQFSYLPFWLPGELAKTIFPGPTAELLFWGKNLYFYVFVNFKYKIVVLSLKNKDTHVGKM